MAYDHVVFFNGVRTTLTRRSLIRLLINSIATSKQLTYVAPTFSARAKVLEKSMLRVKTPSTRPKDVAFLRTQAYCNHGLLEVQNEYIHHIYTNLNFEMDCFGQISHLVQSTCLKS